MPQTKHASIRAQQRGIPPLVDRWLDEFGEEDHDGHGYVRLYFSHRSVREMERALGNPPENPKTAEVEFSKKEVLREEVEIYRQPNHGCLETC
jgi:hypothetical protein